MGILGLEIAPCAGGLQAHHTIGCLEMVLPGLRMILKIPDLSEMLPVDVQALSQRGCRISILRWDSLRMPGREGIPSAHFGQMMDIGTPISEGGRSSGDPEITTAQHPLDAETPSLSHPN
ncbi:hypothetical protein DFH28DRAFT_924194 [Melampsora americana]|nr:hypothetical protein DFH28DRAFT_924194 [Melampsora americana]